MLTLSSVSSVTQPSRCELQVLTSATAEIKAASLRYPPSQTLPPVSEWDLATSSFIMLKAEPGTIFPTFEKLGLPKNVFEDQRNLIFTCWS